MNTTSEYLVSDILNSVKNIDGIISHIISSYHFIKFSNEELSKKINTSSNKTDKESKMINTLIESLNDSKYYNIKNKTHDAIVNAKFKEIPMLLDMCYCYYLIHFYGEKLAREIPVYKLPNEIYKYKLLSKYKNEIDQYFIKLIENKYIRQFNISPNTISMRCKITEDIVNELVEEINPLINQILLLNNIRNEVSNRTE